MEGGQTRATFSPSTACYAGAFGVPERHSVPEKTSGGKEGVFVRRVCQLRTGVRLGVLTASEHEDAQYLKAVVGEAWLDPRAFADWVKQNADSLADILLEARRIARKQSDSSSQEGDEDEDDEEAGVRQLSAQLEGGQDTNNTISMDTELVDNGGVAKMDVADTSSFPASNAPAVLPARADGSTSLYDMPVAASALSFRSCLSYFLPGLLASTGQNEEEQATTQTGLLPKPVDGPYIFGVCLFPSMPWRGSTLPLGGGLLPGDGKLRAMMQCGPDLLDTLRTAKFCFMAHLHPHLGKHISVDINAKDKDLFVHQPYGYMHLEGGSIGLSLVLALVKTACPKAPGLPRFASTGGLCLSGRVLKIHGLREKAIAALDCGMNGLVFPKANEEDLSGPWPDEGAGKPPKEVQRKWDEARKRLVFKAVDRIEQAVHFIFPNLPPLPAGGTSDLPACIQVPLWLLGEGRVRSEQAIMTRVEACLMPGQGQPEAWGGPPARTPEEVELCWQLVKEHVKDLERLLPGRKAVGKKGAKRRKVEKLVLDPRDPRADRHPLVQLYAPSIPVGIYTTAIFIVLCSVVTGLRVRRDVAIATFMHAAGDVARIPGGVTQAVEVAAMHGVRERFLAERDIKPEVKEMADRLKVTVTGVNWVGDLLTDRVFERAD